MSGVRSALALQRLYERYRSAVTLKASARKPGEWLVIEPGSEAATDFEAALGISAGSPGTEKAVNALYALNGALGIAHAQDVRLAAHRTAGSSKLDIRFTLVQRGKGLKGSKPTPRSSLPTTVAQLDLPGEKVDRSQKVSRHTDSVKISGTPVGTEDGGAPSTEAEDATHATGGTDSAEQPVDLVLPDGTPLPDLSDMLTMDELSELWRDGKLPDLVTVETLFSDLSYLLPEDLNDENDVDFSSMADRFRARAVLASGTPPIQPTASDAGDTWTNVSRDVVSWVKTSVRALRDANETGHLLVLAPSPGTGKSRGMMEAADEEQGARRRVGYAVLSRAQIKETADRLRASGPHVRLIVIEGRHEGNCDYMDQVNVATSAGFSPGSTVCPKCPLYPGFGVSRRNICDYYGARSDAARDRKLAAISHRPPAIILTTHASAILGSHIIKRRFQNFWDLDTLFIDEDPTAAMVTEHEIAEGALTYSKLDHKGNPDGPTLGGRLLRDAMLRALREREAAAERGFVVGGGDPDRIHTRNHGSAYAGGDLHALLESVARTMGSSLRAIGAATIDGMSGPPPKGEIMNLTADEVADRFPNRYLAPLFATLDEETTAIAEARAAGIDLEPAYRVHLDLVADGEGGHRPVIRVHLLRGYANGRTNILIGDAYGDTKHYEGLFDRHRRDGKVMELKKRAVWPVTSTFIRIVTHAGAKHLSNTTQLVDHLEVNIRPILELERGRKILFYIHKEMKDDLREWLESVREELELGEYAIEHWAGGRGKDIYRDFNSLVTVSEYVPNVGGLMHESNTVAALASPSNTRVAHWNGYAPRKGSAGLANSLVGADPFYQAAFRRKTTDELAQAVHRIRPAMPPADGRQKRIYVLGHSVPLSDELIAATAATAVVDNGKNDIDLETEMLGRGARFSMTETLGLVSEREVAGAMAEAFRALGCWSHVFAHSLVGVPTWDTVEDLVVRGQVAEGRRRALLYDLPVSEPANDAPLVSRIKSPLRSWPTISRRIADASRIYRAGLAVFIAALPFPQPRRLRTPWMPSGSNGYEFYGDRERFENILDSCYGPNAERVPF